MYRTATLPVLSLLYCSSPAKPSPHPDAKIYREFSQAIADAEKKYGVMGEVLMANVWVVQGKPSHPVRIAHDSLFVRRGMRFGLFGLNYDEIMVCGRFEIEEFSVRGQVLCAARLIRDRAGFSPSTWAALRLYSRKLPPEAVRAWGAQLADLRLTCPEYQHKRYNCPNAPFLPGFVDAPFPSPSR